MKKLFIVLFIFLLPSLLYAVTGDIISATVVADSVDNGWAIDIKIEGVSDQGTYTLGLGANNAPANAKIALTVTSPSFDATGGATTIERTVYGTYQTHLLYPSQVVEHEVIDGSDCTVRVALSDYVYDSDTATVTILADFYTEGGNGNNASTDLAVTNNSTESYPLVIGNWSYPGFHRITGSTFKVRMVGFHRSARSGQPLRVVRFIATDESSNADTTFVTSATIDSDMSDPHKVIEYVGVMSSTNLIQGEDVTVNFKAFPWVGDSGSVLDTSDAANAMPTPLYAPQTWLCDKNNGYGITVAVVATDGNDGTGAVVDSSSFDSGSPPNAYLTIGAATNGIKTYNNASQGHNDFGGGYIFLQEGTYVWTGSDVTAETTDGKTWFTLTKFPGTTRANVIIGSHDIDENIGEKLHLLDIKITNTTTGCFDGMDYVWVDQCDVDASGTATFYQNLCIYFTYCNIYDGGDIILRPYSTTNSSRSLIRGNTWAEANASAVKAYTILGNLMNSRDIHFDFSGQGVPVFDNIIVAYNFILRAENSNPNLYGKNSLGNGAASHGFAIIQNVLERTLNGSPPNLQFAADNTLAENDPVNNVLIWHNTIVGERSNLAYNDVGLNPNGPAYRSFWSVVGNIFDDYNIVTDGDSHGGTPDATCYGGHAAVYGVGYHGNINLLRQGTSDYEGRFMGLNYVYTGSAQDPKFTDDASASADSTGNGDYTLQSDSPAINLILSGMAVLPFDLAGTVRLNDGNGAAGAYELAVGSATTDGILTPNIIDGISGGPSIDGLSP